MARQFNGTNQGAATTANIDLTGTTAVSISMWMWVDASPGADDLAFEFNDPWYAVTGAFNFDLNIDGTRFSLNHNGNVGQHLCYFTPPSFGAWHHYVALYDTSQSVECQLYIDGTSQSVVGGDQSPNNTNAFASAHLSFMFREGGALYAAGRMADFAIYSVRLSGGEITSLAGGTLASAVQTANLKGYWKFCGDTSPEPDSSTGAHNATLTNTPTQVAHPSAITASCTAATLMGAMCL